MSKTLRLFAILPVFFVISLANAAYSANISYEDSLVFSAVLGSELPAEESKNDFDSDDNSEVEESNEEIVNFFHWSTKLPMLSGLLFNENHFVYSPPFPDIMWRPPQV